MNDRLMSFTADVSELQMKQIGQIIGQACQRGSVLYLNGTLGMGKTTLSRQVVQGLGWSGKVKSPTYTLVESYETEHASMLHFDLYRLSDPEELEFIGIRDFDPQQQLWLIEWPELGRGMLPPADLVVTLSNNGSEDRRFVDFKAATVRGEQQLSAIKQDVIASNLECDL